MDFHPGQAEVRPRQRMTGGPVYQTLQVVLSLSCLLVRAPWA